VLKSTLAGGGADHATATSWNSTAARADAAAPPAERAHVSTSQACEPSGA
jgi:hypothetical protein